MSCHSCGLCQLCLPYGLRDAELGELERIIRRGAAAAPGQSIYRSGDGFHAIYVVRTGSVKVQTVDRNGQEQILGFYLPGDLLGLDAIGCDCHARTAVALETTAVCELPFERLEQLSLQMPNLHRRMLQVMSDAIAREEEMLLVLGRMPAEERLARFLVCLSERFHARGYSAVEFHLSMSRHDIGNYLGLAAETLSRLFRRLRDDGILSVQGKLVQISDLERLKNITMACEATRSQDCRRT